MLSSLKCDHQNTSNDEKMEEGTFVSSVGPTLHGGGGGERIL